MYGYNIVNLTKVLWKTIGSSQLQKILVYYETF
jgi:hypothetical protein